MKIKKLVIILLFLNLFAETYSQEKFPISKEPQEFTVSEGNESNFTVNLKKEIWYNLEVEQKGIDVVLNLEHKNKLLKSMDSPNGRFGFERFSFYAKSEGAYTINIKPLVEDQNPNEGKYTLRIFEIPNTLKRFSKKELQKDLDILESAFRETRVGLWYNSFAQIDSIFTMQKKNLSNNMTSLDFFKIVAPLVAYTKEGHSYIDPSYEINNYLKAHGTYFPIFVKILEGRIFALNNIENYKSSGKEITSINGISSQEIIENFLSIEPSDGYNITSKNYWIAGNFSTYFTEFYGRSDTYKVRFKDIKTNKISEKRIKAYNYLDYYDAYKKLKKNNPFIYEQEIASLKTVSNKDYALLKINSFEADDYKEEGGFKKYIDSVFNEINSSDVHNLIIDIRNNEGGTQGMEDILLSHLITKKYKKYRYAQAPAFNFSFMSLTQYRDDPDHIKKYLKRWYFRKEKDGRILSYEKFEAPPASDPFRGNLYILIGGKTFSGGSEFASLAKNNTDAIFIGEETGGGYYGNTSDAHLHLLLPNTQLKIGIPLVKFVVNTTKNNNPYGHGLMPDYEITPSIIDILNQRDKALNFAINLIAK